MSKKAKVDQSNFKTKLTSVFKRVQTIREDMQDLLIFALDYFVETGNTVYVAMILNEATSGQRLSSANISQLRSYVKDFSNIKIKANNDNSGYVLTKKKKEAPIFNKPSNLPWYEYKRPQQALKQYDLVQVVVALRSKYDNAAESDRGVKNKIVSDKILTKIDSIINELNLAPSK